MHSWQYFSVCKSTLTFCKMGNTFVSAHSLTCSKQDLRAVGLGRCQSMSFGDHNQCDQMFE